jgi:hypothetical protein
MKLCSVQKCQHPPQVLQSLSNVYLFEIEKETLNQKGANTLQKIKSWHWRFTNNLGELIQN